MPTYDFQCRGCGLIFETKLSMADYASGSKPACPDCKNQNSERAYTAPINVITAHRPDVSIVDYGPGSCRSNSGGCGSSGSCC